ncbi:MAG TPA: ABC transporter ATP-binding protein [Polyangia bacterium]|nr:ABC transporter ATP-binding protein [Polyangia bacterium]
MIVPHPLPTSGPPPPEVGLAARLKASAEHSARALGLVWRSAPGGVVALTIFTVVAAALPPFVAYVGKMIIDAVIAARSAGPGIARHAAMLRAVRLVGVELAAVVVIAGCERVLGLVRQLVGLRLGIDLNVRILEKALRLELRHFEDPEFYDKLTRARREASTRPLSLIQSNFQVVRGGLTLIGYIALLVRFSGWMALAVLVATIPAFIAEARFSGAAFRLRNWRSPDSRRLTYLEYVLANDEHAKEVKLFGLGPLLLDRYRTLAESFFADDRRLAVRRAAWGYALSLLSTAVFYGSYALIVVATVRGKLSLGDMTLGLVAFRQGQQSFQAVLSALGGMYEDTLYMSNLFDYLAIPTDLPPARALDVAGQSPPPLTAVRAEEGIRFEGVGFRYPGGGPNAERWALRGVDVFVPKGQSLALVGENGAGKTTFIKLLANLYQPTEGSVLLDGRDLRSWDETELRRRIGVIFQDFNEYQLALRENVAFGSVDHLTDDLRVGRAVDQGGAKELVAGLSSGLETQLGRWFGGGVELSGGQWQKVALSRAFMRTEADILILDEPTAALDAEAEHAVFQRFKALAAGRTTILISHRFPTVRMADRILVLEAGRVIEDGSHAELVAAGHRYARMFGLQAAGYR